jgi:predicted metalloprotease
MRWTPGRMSRNVEDRRGSGGMGMAPMGIGGAVLMLVLSLVFGRDFMSDGSSPIPLPMSDSAGGNVAPINESAAERSLSQFVGFVLDDAQKMWASRVNGYRDARLVLFRDATPTGCGVGQSAMGPFYCPQDEKIYIDLGFYDQLRDRFGAPGDFAQAYVLAHEVGHHVQHLLGTDLEVRRAQQMNPRAANQLSVAMELQADCYAGVWGYAARDSLDAGDIEEGLAAASAVGDDRIQRQTTGRVNHDSFTHGSAEQRAAWFRKGFSSGDPKQCDTFGARR